LRVVEGVEQVELTQPWKAVEDAGDTPELVSTEVGTDDLPAFCSKLVEAFSQ
jgi:putative intracellular protease/amidase